MANGNIVGQPVPGPANGLPTVVGQPLPQPFIPQTGVIGAQNVIQQGTREALGTLGGGIEQGRRDISQGFGIARGDIREGGQGIETQAALAGLRGPDAQARAFAGFESSPGQQFLQQEAERALTRTAAATGGLSGGNVLRELQRQAVGLAQQDFSNQFQRGQQVLGSQQQQAGNLANLSAQRGQQRANLASQGGQLGANLIAGATGQLGQQRFGAGQQLAQAATGTAANLANLQQALGQGISGITGQGTTNIANLLSGTGSASAQLNQQLASILANIATGSASQTAPFTSLAGQFDAAATAGQNTAVQNAITQLIQGTTPAPATTTTTTQPLQPGPGHILT